MSGKFNTLPLGDNPTLIGRVQRFVGNTLFNLGFRRLGWDIGSYSWSKRHLCGCGRRSRTEREHLLHHCTEPDWDNWPRIDA